MNNTSQVVAGGDIIKNQHVRTKIEGDDVVAYPVRARYADSFNPVALESADEGETLMIKS